MKKKVGVWIDHEKAVVVFLVGNDVEIKLVTSNIEKERRQSGAATPADDIRQRKSTVELGDFYDEVTSNISDAGEILILGPGEAKGELRKQLEKNHIAQRVVGIEAADRMTDPQIVAKVRGYFHDQRSGTGSK